MNQSKNKIKSISSQATWYFIGQVASFFVVFWVPIILVRVLSKTDYGRYAQLLLIYTFIFRLLQFGLRHSLYYFLPHDNRHKKYFITNTYICYIIGGFIAFLTLSIFRQNIACLFFDSDIAGLLPICGLHVLFMLISCPFEPVLVIETKAELAGLLKFFSELIRGIFVIAFVLIFKSVFAVLIALTCYSSLRFIFYTWYIFKFFGWKLNKYSIIYLKNQFKYAAPMGFSGIIGSIYKRIDQFILAAFFTPEVFAVYRIGNFKIPFINMLFNSVGEVILPRAVKFLKQDKISDFLDLWNKLLIRFSFVGIGAFFILQVIAHDLITLLFTERYESSTIVFRVILVLIFGQMLGYGLILRALGHTKEIFLSNLIAFVCSIPLTFCLIKYFGVTGAATAAVSAYYINAIAQLIYSIKKLKKRVSEIFPVPEIIKMTMAGLILMVFLLITQELIPYKILRLLMASSLFSIAYIYICNKINIFNLLREEIFQKILGKVKLASLS